MRWRGTDPVDPSSRRQLPFLVGSAVVITALAQVTQPGSLGELLLLGPAVMAFLLRGLLPHLPAEVFAALV